MAYTHTHNQTRRMWTDLVERAKVDVTHGAAAVMARHFGVAPFQLQAETLAEQTLRWCVYVCVRGLIGLADAK